MDKGVRNIGLCGGMRPEDFEAMRDTGLIKDGTGIAAVAVTRCVLCHFNRGLPATGASLTQCTGVAQNTYNVLARLERDGFITEAGREKVGRYKQELISYMAASPEMEELAAAIPIPDRCTEVAAQPG